MRKIKTDTTQLSKIVAIGQFCTNDTKYSFESDTMLLDMNVESMILSKKETTLISND